MKTFCFFISLLQMHYHFQTKSTTKYNTKRIFLTYFGKNYLYGNTNYVQEFHFAIQNEITVLGIN